LILAHILLALGGLELTE